MSTDINSNFFYNLMLDTNKSQPDKHAELLALFNKQASKADTDKLKTEYSHFRGFLMGKHDAIKQRLDKAQDKLLDMSQELDAGSLGKDQARSWSTQNATELDRLSDNNRSIEDILSTMFSAEAASSAFDKKASADTTSLYTDVQSQDQRVTNMQTWNANMLQQAENPAPAPVVTPQKKAHSFGPDVIVLQKDITAPERATFKKRIR